MLCPMRPGDQVMLFEPHGEWNAEAFLATLADMGYSAIAAGTTAGRREYHDTRDGTLRRKGCTLWHSVPPSRWHLQGLGEELVHDAPAGRLPDGGSLAEAVSQMCSSRRVFSCLLCDLAETRWSLQSATTRPVTLEALECVFSDPGGNVPDRRAVLLSLTRARATGMEVRYLISLLKGTLGLRETEGSIVELGLEHLGLPLPGGALPSDLAPARGDTVPAAAVKVIRTQAFRLRANTPGAARDVDPEYVHDLRVATRRSRFALKLFDGILEPASCVRLRAELAWLAALLGNVRDLDVLAQRLERQIPCTESSGEFRDALGAWISSRRGEALRELRGALGSIRYSELLDSLETMREVAQTAAERSGPALSAFAGARISQAVRKLSSAAGTAGDTSGAAELHAIRILFKRLRYTCEFFLPYVGGGLSRLIELLVSFQDCLGVHQDACSAADLLGAWASEMPGILAAPRQALSLGALLQLQRDERHSQADRFRALWESSSDLLAHWRRTHAAGAEE